jgi:peptide/nickel transport system permease protein
MGSYLTHRLLLFIPSAILATFLVFAMVRVVPGNVVDLMLSENGSGYSHGDLEHRLGLDQPILKQYLNWVSGVLRGDLGRSLWNNQPATAEIARALPITLELTGMALVIAIVIGLSIGVFAATRPDTPLDYLFRSFSILGLSIPGFWIATLVILFPAIWWGLTPSFSYIPVTQDPAGNFAQFLLPAAILGIERAASYMRFTRTSMLEVLRRDYVRTSRAKGLGERSLVIRHALRNALIPVVTLIGLSVPILLSGTVILESIFALPGMGQLTLRAVTQRDYPILQAVVLFYAFAVLFSNLAVDLGYGWLDPRIRNAGH